MIESFFTVLDYYGPVQAIALCLSLALSSLAILLYVLGFVGLVLYGLAWCIDNIIEKVKGNTNA